MEKKSDVDRIKKEFDIRANENNQIINQLMTKLSNYEGERGDRGDRVRVFDLNISFRLLNWKSKRTKATEKARMLKTILTSPSGVGLTSLNQKVVRGVLETEITKAKTNLGSQDQVSAHLMSRTISIR